ncbi:SDR family oxidoreductase [Corynebacterium epidermidicanis]|uniref:Short-chain alcohol dehydrogenase n=1 Tax=Corynebacterium epidermidicanis TaxID=1050174 RepID=A0A0G3GSY6_9CORY|nr:SDR family oxidoreductase [Corynebacterium epidermidicanis]AKK04239.1 short-chain alcohol dehydrogenase [Corynebacterium epidermidicanis]
MSAKQIAVITGASSGVGLAVAKQCADLGYTVYAHYRTAPAFEASEVHWWQADFPDLGEIPELSACDLLVHCAGVCELSPVSETTLSDWQAAMDVNLLGPVALTNALLPALRAAGGHVIYINSGAGLRANPTWGTYAASKFAARAWCDALRAEEPKIRVTSVHPGRIDTPMQEAIVKSEGGTYDGAKFLQSNTVATAVLNLVQLPADTQPNSIELRPRS